MTVLSSDNSPYSILALDTATQACSVALAYQGDILHRYLNEPRGHAKKLLPMIDELLSEAGIAITQLDGLAFTAGPGSFTGLRIGMGVIQGLAFGADLPVASVSTLQTLAQGAVRNSDLVANTVIMPLLDARMDELYWGLYKQHEGLAEPLCEDGLASPEDIAKRAAVFAHNVDLGVGDGWQFQSRLGVSAGDCDLSAQPNALDVLTLAQPLYAAGKQQAIDDVQLIYLRDSLPLKKVSRKKHQKLRHKDS